MAEMKDLSFSMKMRDVIADLVRQEVDKLRPRYRYAAVSSIDLAHFKADVVFTGESTPVTVNTGHLGKFLSVADVVRIEGIGTDKFITDIRSWDGDLSGLVGNVGTSAAMADTLARRDASGRTQFATPSATADAATKGYVDGAGTSGATPNTLVHRDASGRTQFVDPTNAADATTKSYVDNHNWGAGDITSGTLADGLFPQRLQETAQEAHTDWNNYQNTGFYRGNSIANAPTAGTWYYVEVMRHDGSYCVQFATNYYENRQFYRRRQGNAWLGWVEIANTAHVANAVNAVESWRGVNLPAFRARRTTNLSKSGTTSRSSLVCDAVYLNNRGCYNNVNGRFTAPVTGYYSFSISTVQTTSATGPEISAAVNDVDVAANLCIGYYTAYMTFGATVTVYMTAGQYFNFYWQNQNNTTVTLDGVRTTMSGHYLG